MQTKFINSKTVKRASVVVDILVPFMLYFSLKAQNLFISALLMITVILAKVLLVIVRK
jgi:hypothetical protein